MLGIDPGTAICGWGVVELTRGGRLLAHGYGAITTSPKASMPARLLTLADGLEGVIGEHSPEAMGVERLYFGRNVTTAIPVGQARGVVLLTAARHGLEVVERTPGEVKQAVTGYGKATKAQVIAMVTRLLALRKAPSPDDVADALAVAVSALYWRESLEGRNGLEAWR